LGEQGYDPKKAIRESDSILFAVTPDEQINAIAAEHAGEFHKGQVCLECSTTKLQIARTLLDFDGRGLSVCSIHPGARADLPARGQNMLIMPVGQHGAAAEQQARELAALLEMIPIDFVRFEQHAKAMAIIQAMDHALQRAKIETLRKLLPLFGFTLEEVMQMAFANTRINMLGTGRVGIQQGVSAKIIREAQALPETRKVLETLISSLHGMQDADATVLTAAFQADMEAIDPAGLWRRQMLSRTSSVLEQMANLDIKGITIYSPRNEPGVLEEITHVLRVNGINITAITSHNLEPEEGRPGVIFHMGIDEKCVFDMQKLTADLAAINVAIE
jgi:prephenate dehydrogenase